MARLYSDEGFPKQVSIMLRALSHDVLTVQDAGKDNQRIPDEQVLAYAIEQERAVLTVDRADFIKLHKINPNHAGIIVCTRDFDRRRLANRIHTAIVEKGSLAKKLIRVNRSNDNNSQ